MNANDYLIDHAKFDWQALLAGWVDILPKTFTIWLVNRFGDVFIIAEDGSIHHLDIALGTLDRVASTRDEFAALVDAPQNANNWLMIPLVDRCVKSGMSLGLGQCYGFKVPPILGGAYEPENVAPMDLAENYAYLAEMREQTKDMPDGTRVRQVIGPHPKRQ